MIRLGATPAQAGVGGAPSFVELGGVRAPYEAFVTGTVPTDKITYQDGTLDIFDAAGRLIYAHTPRYKGRGNSTWDAPKKPFKVRSLDRLQTPFGFPASRDWALMADYYDQSYLRTAIAFELGRRATGRWTPRSHTVRLTWNGIYRGLYRYSETVDVQAGRVDIREMQEEDTAGTALTGPYLLEVNNPLDGPGFETSRGTPVLYDVPDVEGVPAQETYIPAWVESLETALVTGTEAECLALIDLASWVDWYLLAESTKSMDTDWQKSCKWYKDQDSPDGTGKAVLWPPWDYDLSLGLSWTDVEESPTGWNTRAAAIAGEGSYPNWLWHLWEKSPTFRDACRAAWAERFAPAIAGLGEYIDTRATEISPHVASDRALWYSGTPQPTRHTPAWISEWLADRAAWITANL